MKQFAKLPYTLKKESPEVQALWACCAYYLTVPGFKGSLKRLVKSLCKTNAAFTPAWIELRNKYLKIIRIPNGENCFETRYELYSAPQNFNDIFSFSAAEARKYILKNPQHKVFNNGYYTAVPVDMLKDNTLSLKAKGIFIALKKLFDLRKNGNHVEISKNALMQKCKLKRSGIDAAWSELKLAGYIIQRRYVDDITGLFGWGYELCDNPKNVDTTAKKKIAKKSKERIIEAAPAKEVAMTAAERQAIRDAVRQNIEYDILIANAGNHEVPYSVDDIIALEQIMVDTVCTAKPYVLISGESIPSDDVRKAILRLSADDIITLLSNFNARTGKIRNLRAYKLTSLYFAACNRGTTIA